MSDCEACGEEYAARAANQRYCSVKCQSKAAAERRVPSKKTCQECGEQFQAQDRRQKFCSHSHAASFNNRHHPKRRPEGACQRCGGVLPRGRKFCSRQCMLGIPQWLNGELSASGKSGRLLAWAREFLMEEAGWRCSECGWGTANPVTGKPILTIEHLDGNWKNNLRSNLKVLCYNCHSLTPTFGALNKGSLSGRRPWASNR